MHALTAVGEVGHKRPKVHESATECLLGTRSRFDPLQFHSGAVGSIAYDINRESREAIFSPNLDWWNVLETNSQNTSLDGRPVDRDIPRDCDDYQAGR